jgi:hypothetical protein
VPVDDVPARSVGLVGLAIKHGHGGVGVDDLVRPAAAHRFSRGGSGATGAWHPSHLSGYATAGGIARKMVPSHHPSQNPTGLSNLVLMLAIAVIAGRRGAFLELLAAAAARALRRPIS